MSKSVEELRRILQKMRQDILKSSTSKIREQSPEPTTIRPLALEHPPKNPLVPPPAATPARPQLARPIRMEITPPPENTFRGRSSPGGDMRQGPGGRSNTLRPASDDASEGAEDIEEEEGLRGLLSSIRSQEIDLRRILLWASITSLAAGIYMRHIWIMALSSVGFLGFIFWPSREESMTQSIDLEDLNRRVTLLERRLSSRPMGTGSASQGSMEEIEELRVMVRSLYQVLQESGSPDAPKKKHDRE